MTTKSGARIYHGAPRNRLEPGACPQCGRVVRVNPSGRRKLHRDFDGVDCTGSGVTVGDAPMPEVDPDAVAEAWRAAETHSRWAGRDRARPANPWSGKVAP